MATTTETTQVRRGVVMVGPPYLYNGAQVCGRRTSRTCIFLLAAFSTAFIMIGIVFFTADLRMESYLWAAGLTFILFGVVLLVWFLTLCCSARYSFKGLPASHPARTRPSAPGLVPPRSSTYQLLPMTSSSAHNTPIPQASATRTLPISPIHKTPAMTDPTGYPTWGHGGYDREYGVRPSEVQTPVYAWTTAPRQPGRYQRPRGYPDQDNALQYYTSAAPTEHILRSSTPAHQGTLPSGFRLDLSAYRPPKRDGEDNPPPYHTVVPGP